MSDIPHIVRDRLRTGPAGDPHPDADVLAAFAEHSLTPGERENVVRHLSRCGDCREVVALSLPPMEESATAVEKVQTDAGSFVDAGTASRSWFAWPTLRWAALAAGVVVVASVAMLHPGKSNVEQTPTLTATNQPVATPPPLVESVKGKKDNVLNDEVRVPTNRRKEMDGAVPPALKAPEPAKAPAGMSSGARLQSGTAGSLLADKKRADLPLFGNNIETRQAAPAAQSVMGGVSETVEVTSASPAVSVDQTEVAQASPVTEKLTARADDLAPITKAKAPAKEEKVQAAEAADKTDANLARPYSVVGGMVAKRSVLGKDAAAQWSFSQGVLRRSFDGGASWQIALQLEYPLLSFGALGSHVWAGGAAGALFHSVDNGTTWTQVQPSAKGGSFGGDIVSIEIRSPAEIVLSTGNKEFWSTADGGKTWEKK